MSDLDEILEEEVTAEQEYLDDQCPDCLVVFESDDELLNHVCSNYVA